jgi:hypothetical protein
LLSVLAAEGLAPLFGEGNGFIPRESTLLTIALLAGMLLAFVFACVALIFPTSIPALAVVALQTKVGVLLALAFGPAAIVGMPMIAWAASDNTVNKMNEIEIDAHLQACGLPSARLALPPREDSQHSQNSEESEHPCGITREPSAEEQAVSAGHSPPGPLPGDDAAKTSPINLAISHSTVLKQAEERAQTTLCS